MKGVARRLVARNVRALRTSKAMTQEDVAGAAEIDRSYVSLIENAHFSISVDLIEKLADVFDVEIFELLHPDTAGKLKTQSKA